MWRFVLGARSHMNWALLNTCWIERAAQNFTGTASADGHSCLQAFSLLCPLSVYFNLVGGKWPGRFLWNYMQCAQSNMNCALLSPCWIDVTAVTSVGSLHSVSTRVTTMWFFSCTAFNHAVVMQSCCLPVHGLENKCGNRLRQSTQSSCRVVNPSRNDKGQSILFWSHCAGLEVDFCSP